MWKRCLFDSLVSKGKQPIFSYVSSAALRPDTVVPEAYTLINSAMMSPAQIDSVIYEPATGAVTLYPERDMLQLSGASFFLTTDETLLTVDGNLATYNGNLSSSFGLYAEEGEVSVISMQYVKNGVPVYDISGESDFSINIVAVNTTKTKYESVPYTVYSKENGGVELGSGNAFFDERGIASFTVSVTGYVVTSTDDISVEFAY